MTTIEQKQRDVCYDMTFQMWHDIQRRYGSILIPSSIPVMWFGNMDAYLNAEKRILTLSVNPSDKEFEESRFNGVTAMDPMNRAAFYDALNQYFMNHPYMKWFQPYEAALKALGHSYKTDVVHLDYFTSIATNPTWGKLGKATKLALETAYKPIFQKMLALLKPDIILMSSTQKAAQDVAQQMNANSDSYQIRKGKMLVATVYAGPGGLVINGRNMGTPMSGLKYKNEPELQEMVAGIVKKYRTI